jgi:hypothetical protein
MAYTTGGENISGQFGMPLYGVSGLPPFTGNYFFVSESGGSDGNTGGPQDPLKTLTQALALCVDGNNDVVFLSGTVHVTATVAWSKGKTHLIGLAPPLNSQARARISQTGSAVFSPLVNVTGSECIFQNIGTFHGFNDASTQICWIDSGGRNRYENCFFAGMGHATAAAQAGSRSLVVDGTTGENTFSRCTIGLDTVVRATSANASLEFTNHTPRNVFDSCIFLADVSDAADLHVLVASGGIDRFALFKNCTFLNSTDSGATAMTVAFTVNASAGGSVLLQYCSSHGATVYASTGPIYVDGAVPTGNTSGLAVAAT